MLYPLDITMPGKTPLLGKKHPITQTFEEIIKDIHP